MFDFNTAVQTALSPVVTLPVIAILTIVIVAQTRRTKNRLRAQAKRLGKMTGAILAAVTDALESEMDRRVNRAIEFTYDTLKADQTGKRPSWADSDTHFGEPVKNTGDGGTVLEDKGSRPYHAATADFAPRDPRAPRAG